ADVHPRAGAASWTFLKIGAGARYAALADAGAALADDATACHWNPARLANLERSWSLQVQHNRWIDSTSVDEIYLAAGGRKHRLGVSARLFSSGDIPLRGETPTADPVSYYTAYDFSGALSYAFAPNQHLSAGATFRSLYEKIYLNSAYGWSVDGGLNVNLMNNDLSLAGVIANVGPRMQMRRDLFRLPTAFTLAASYKLPWTVYHGRFQTALAGVKAVDAAWQARLGAEYWWNSLAAGRLGYKIGHDTERFSAGLGIRWRNYTLDYALVPHRYDLGASHRVSLDLRF
ncbi:MAG: PorV/PorQ family protein, partial [Candidatus Edwardsbacteria bacterium]|nr:PorV/PorQ family protein [Candidatus Edwardsbacteria bacterium]